MRQERQLTFDLPSEPAYGLEDFLVSPSNKSAYSFIERWPQWQDSRALLIGPAGSGKTHLASIWAEASKAILINARNLAEAQIPTLLAGGALVVEDADRAESIDATLFHLFNLARETGASLLVTARTPPSQWGLCVPDLLSRLRALEVIEIAAPDDALLRSVLVKLFVDRQLVVDTSTIDYLALHLDRSLDAAREAVAALDREALSRGRRITRPMAVDLLKSRAEQA